jgi:site-specific recombinase XerD
MSKKRFEKYLQKKGILSKTLSRQQREVNKYLSWLGQKEKDAEAAEKKDILDYLQHVKQSRNIENSTLNNTLQALKNYYSYLSQEHGANNVTEFIKIRGTNRQHLRQLFTPDELDLLCDDYYNYAQNYNPNARELNFYPDYNTLLQGRFIALTLMAYQAVQPSEILELTADDFNFRKATVTIHESRRGANRTLSLDASQIGIMMQYFADGDKPIMPNVNHFERLNVSLKTLHSKYADLRQLRASVITNWIKVYGLRKAQYLAGHKQILSTERYLAHNFEKLQNDMDNFHPLR